MNRKCPACGVLEKEDGFIKNFCQACFIRNFSLCNVPAEILIDRCAVCGRIRKGDEWIEENKASLEPLVLSKVKSQYSFSLISSHFAGGRNFFDVSLNLVLNIEGKEIKAVYHTRIKFEATQCLDCSRQTGGYFDAIVQLRGKKEEQTDFEKLENKLNKLLKLVEEKGGRVHRIEKVYTGLDAYVAGINAAMQACHASAKSVKHTRKLIGRKKGKDLYRHTFCVRL